MTERPVALTISLALLLFACGGDRPSNRIEGKRRPASSIQQSVARQDGARKTLLAEGPSAVGGEKRILFGDLHVHTTYSIDAFVYSLPLFGGEGVHPPADACDFARYCSGVDFFALTDHAEGLTPEQWRDIRETMRDCNARAGDPSDPDLVAFVGWEWTQVGRTPETHYGHKNVIFPGLAEDELPARPITSLDARTMSQAPGAWGLRGLDLAATLTPGGYGMFLEWMSRLARFRDCEPGVDTRRLPADCRENAATPRELFDKLDQWGFDTLVIPHGLAWGLHSPLGARMDNQLNAVQHDPNRQLLLEIYSGHGNSEIYRPWGDLERNQQGQPVCPAPTADFLPCCWRAGEIMRQRCGDLPADECDRRVEEAKRYALEAGVDPHLVFPDAAPEDWLDCDQCRDCFKPTYSMRARESAQYSLAITNLSDGDPLRFRWGFVASSDDHHARPGTGYKQLGRHWMADTHGFASSFYDRLLRERVMGKQKDPQRAQPVLREVRSLASLFEVERVGSFMYPGGLVGVHAEARDRQSIWKALKRREVYGTSGPRILLWFDLLNGPRGRAPMGSEVAMSEAPRFEVRATGSTVQMPGCPEESLNGLSPARLESLCHGECDNPADDRYRIRAVEIIRIRPQINSTESAGELIEDPWRRFECPPDTAGCVATFEDPDFALARRDTVYYARAIQEDTPAINGANLRTRFDERGNPLAVSPCFGSYRIPREEDCLAPVAERAWSSPIFVDAAE